MKGCALLGSDLGAMKSLTGLSVLFGYAISGERTLEEFYESLQPFAIPNVRIV